jgi:hypothetical protein
MFDTWNKYIYLKKSDAIRANSNLRITTFLESGSNVDVSNKGKFLLRYFRLAVLIRNSSTCLHGKNLRRMLKTKFLQYITFHQKHDT